MRRSIPSGTIPGSGTCSRRSRPARWGRSRRSHGDKERGVHAIMSHLDPDLRRDIAEYPNSFGPLGPKDERIETPRYTLCMGRGTRWNTVQRQRFSGAEVDEVLEEVRSLLRMRGRGTTQWEIGSAAEPRDLVDLLLQRGLFRDREPFAVALALTTEPPPAPSDVVSRRVQTFEEYAAANEVQLEAFGAPEEEAAEQRRLLPERWRESP